MAALYVSGELDISSVPLLAERLACEQNAGKDVVVDLEEVSFMDGAGLRLLATAARGGPRLWVTPGPPQVQRLFALSGAGRVLNVLPSAVPNAA